MKSRIVGPLSGGGGVDPDELRDAFIEALDMTQGERITEQRFHDSAVTTIPDRGTTPVEVGTTPFTAAVTARRIRAMTVETTIGYPLQLMSGASAAAAIAVAFIARGGTPTPIRVDIAAGQRIYVRTLTTDSVTSGELTLNLFGE